MTVEWTATQLGTLFPAVTAHLREPLSSLALAMQEALPEEDREQFPELDQKAARMDKSYYVLLRFVENLSNVDWLTDSRSPRRQRCEIGSLVSDICVRSADYMEELGRSMTFCLPPGEHSYNVDPDAIRMSLFHLLSNALKFTPAGGSIRVELNAGEAGFRLSVSNTGEGISEEMASFLSDRCQNPNRMDPPPHGLGLGLPLCQAIAKAHGGRMLVETRTGVDCRVTISIPNVLDCVVADLSPVEYNAGFDPVLLGLADALPSPSFLVGGGLKQIADRPSFRELPFPLGQQ